MRITKVKVDNKDVIMQRDAKEGFLKLGDISHKEQGVVSFIQRKKADFIKSIMGKTLVKPDTFKKKPTDSAVIKKDKEQKTENLKQLTKIFDFILSRKKPKYNNKFYINILITLSKNDLKAYFNHKFHQEVEYGLLNKRTSFNLIDELYQALQNSSSLEEISDQLSDYSQWQKWYIERKQQLLAKSITNNKIDYQKNDSPRKKVLDSWAKEQVLTPSKDIVSILAKHFRLDALCCQWLKDVKAAPRWSQEDVEKEKDNNKKEIIKAKLGSLKDHFEFKRSLKSSLLAHQRISHKAGCLSSGSELSQYSIEVSKYLMHYFPLKKSDRRLSDEYITHYLSVKQVTCYIKNQIDNAIMNHLLQQGKAIYYQLDNQINSEKLQQIKSQEAFALQFIDACAFAGNNLRNCIDPTTKADLLSKNILVPAYHALATNPEKLKQSQYNLARFFTTFTINPDTFAIQSNHKKLTTYFQQTNDEYKNFVAAVRSAISNIRNEVFHFKPEALNTVLNITEFESLTEKTPNISYQNSYLQTCFKQEIENLPNLWCEKLKSASLFDFYKRDELKKHFSTFDLCSKPLAFIPGFKTVFKWGVKYTEDREYPLNLGDTYFRKTLDDDQSQIDPAKQARYNAMAIIYEQQFIQHFTNNIDAFYNAVDTVLKANKQRAIDKVDNRENKNKHAFAFSEITKPATEQSIQDYLKSIQSQLIQEENKKRDDDPKFSELETGHFQQFLWQVFMKGFDSYIQQSEFAYLGKPENLINTNNQNNAEQSYQRNKLAYNYIDHIHVKHEKISVNSGGQIAFWTLCKMLDAKHLNELLNQMTKWQQATGKLNLPINKQIKPYQQIIQLCVLSVDRISGNWQDHYDGKKEHYFSTLKPYLAGNVDHQHLFSLKSVFAQQDGSPIVIAPVEMAKKYATENIIKQVIDKKIDFKLSQQNITDWQKQKEDQSNDSPANLAKKRQELHLDWTKNKKKDLKNWLKTNNQNYKNICEQLEQCNWLDNKVHLIHIHRLHHLLMDILGRMVGFVALFDRDFQFLDLGCTQYRQNDDLQLDAFIQFREAIGQISAKELNSKGEIKFDKLENIYHRKHLKFLSDLFPTLSINEQTEVQMQMETKRKFYNTHFFEPNFDVFKKRNSIAHFNYLGKLECSILTYLADLRKLVGYDRKLKNAVAKSFIDLLDKHGIEIKLKLSHLPNNKIEIDVDEKDGKPKIKSKQISHLGGAVKIDQHPQEYIEMVRALLELGEKP